MKEILVIELWKICNARIAISKVLKYLKTEIDFIATIKLVSTVIKFWELSIK